MGENHFNKSVMLPEYLPAIASKLSQEVQIQGVQIL